MSKLLCNIFKLFVGGQLP